MAPKARQPRWQIAPCAQHALACPKRKSHKQKNLRSTTLHRTPTRSLPLRMQKLHQIRNLIRLQHIPERRHRRAAVMNLMCNLLLLQPLSHRTQIRCAIGSPRIRAMAVFTTLLMKQHRPSRLTVLRSMNHPNTPMLQPTQKSSASQHKPTRPHNHRSRSQSPSQKAKVFSTITHEQQDPDSSQLREHLPRHKNKIAKN
jgi:hypothetical protein